MIEHPHCEHCGKEIGLPFECKFCGGYYCLEHRLPENHGCLNLPPRQFFGNWPTKDEIVSEHREENIENYPILQKKRIESDKTRIEKPFPTKLSVLFY